MNESVSGSSIRLDASDDIPEKDGRRIDPGYPVLLSVRHLDYYSKVLANYDPFRRQKQIEKKEPVDLSKSLSAHSVLAKLNVVLEGVDLDKGGILSVSLTQADINQIKEAIRQDPSYDNHFGRVPGQFMVLDDAFKKAVNQSQRIERPGPVERFINRFRRPQNTQK